MFLRFFLSLFVFLTLKNSSCFLYFLHGSSFSSCFFIFVLFKTFFFIVLHFSSFWFLFVIFTIIFIFFNFLHFCFFSFMFLIFSFHFFFIFHHFFILHFLLSLLIPFLMFFFFSFFHPVLSHFEKLFFHSDFSFDFFSGAKNLIFFGPLQNLIFLASLGLRGFLKKNFENKIFEPSRDSTHLGPPFPFFHVFRFLLFRFPNFSFFHGNCVSSFLFLSKKNAASNICVRVEQKMFPPLSVLHGDVVS